MLVIAVIADIRGAIGLAVLVAILWVPFVVAVAPTLRYEVMVGNGWLAQRGLLRWHVVDLTDLRDVRGRNANARRIRFRDGRRHRAVIWDAADGVYEVEKAVRGQVLLASQTAGFHLRPEVRRVLGLWEDTPHRGMTATTAHAQRSAPAREEEASAAHGHVAVSRALPTAPQLKGLKRRLRRLDERVPGFVEGEAREAAERIFAVGDRVRIGTIFTWGDFFFDRTGHLVETTHLRNGKKAWNVRVEGRMWRGRQVRIAERALVRIVPPSVWPPSPSSETGASK
jgi:hypothetical protein